MLLEKTLQERDVNEVMTIPISKIGGRDGMYWVGNEKEIYSIKSGYIWAKQLKQRRRREDKRELNQSKNMQGSRVWKESWGST